MKSVILIIIFLITDLIAQTNNVLVFDNIKPIYYSLEDIKPILKNVSNLSAYLCWGWPFGARLMRYNSASEEWEKSIHDYGYCGTVSDKDVAREISSNSSQEINVEVDLTFEKEDHHIYFMSDDMLKKQVNGKYKLVIEYALEPWIVSNSPKEIFSLESVAFKIKIKKKK